MKRPSASLFACNAALFAMAGGLLSLLPDFAQVKGDPLAAYLTAFSLAWMAVGVTFTAVCHPAWNALRIWIAVGLISAPGVALMGRYDSSAVLALWTATVSVAWGIMAVLLQAHTRGKLWNLAPSRRAAWMFATIVLGGSAGIALRAFPSSAQSYSTLFDLLSILWLAWVVVGILGLEGAYSARALPVASSQQ
jgi:hypothetical protein